MQLTLPALVLVLPAALSAQTLGGDLRTVTPYGVFALEGMQLDFKSWPANTALPQGQMSVDANTNGSAASTIVGWRVANGVLSCDVSEQGIGNVSSAPVFGGSTPSPSVSSVRQGPHALLLRVLGTGGLRGRLQVWATGLAEAGATVTLGIDLLNDNSIDFQVVASSGNAVFDRRQWDLNLDGNGELYVRIVTDANVTLPTGSTRFKTGISVVFTPGAFCDIGGYGTSCGPRLTGSDNVLGQDREIVLQLADAPPMVPGLLVLGTQQLSVPIPGTSCLLQTDPLVVLPFATDTYGSAQRKLRAPLSLVLAVNFQDIVVLPAPSLSSSNGLMVRCRR